MDEARRTSFDRKAEQYDATRPSYPAALVDDVIARCAPARMLEIGAGTGKATVLFARAQRELVAVEPGANLAAVLRRNVAAFPLVSVEETRFEAYTGGGFDLVYAAQAMHWVDPAVRYTKVREVLRPGGALAVIYNQKAAIEQSPEMMALRRELDAAYAQWLPGTGEPDEVGATIRLWTREIEASGQFGPVHIGQFPWTASYTSRDYVALLDTYSDHAVLPPERQRPLYDAITSAIARRGDRIEIRYVALVFLAVVR
jgi:SAM-dependent methyltransferase